LSGDYQSKTILPPGGSGSSSQGGGGGGGGRGGGGFLDRLLLPKVMSGQVMA